MIEAIQASVAASTQAGTGTTAASQSQHSPQAAGEQMRDFAASMERAGTAGPANSEGAGTVLSATGTAEPQGTRAILSALESLNGGAERIESMSHSLTAGSSDFTPGEMIQLTMRAHQFLFTAQLTSNVANRSSDGIQQLFRQQS
ncbi:hypothetical protein LY625_03545 [Lysobacter sp. GX 14042]|uniref:hypothetical protein n=1 Tax=Lysobacter sp. GX 14042 TaxID=2907155 RepID=UPI001F2FC12D|nr:hypothetical protein [Lysobacter sp. GX 14042]MCE7031698.1 hypothetical protein [Lysobacter sp. GX 14042]